MSKVEGLDAWACGHLERRRSQSAASEEARSSVAAALRASIETQIAAGSQSLLQAQRADSTTALGNAQGTATHGASPEGAAKRECTETPIISAETRHAIDAPERIEPRNLPTRSTAPFPRIPGNGSARSTENCVSGVSTLRLDPRSFPRIPRSFEWKFMERSSVHPLNFRPILRSLALFC